jgi:hypothetical protein
MTLKKLGEQAGIDSCALSKAIYWFQARLKEDPQLAALLAQANSHLSSSRDPIIHQPEASIDVRNAGDFFDFDLKSLIGRLAFRLL